MKLQIMFVVLAIVVLLLSGCATPEPSATTASTVSSSGSIEGFDIPSLLDDVELTLPDSIARKHVSDTRDYFYKDGEVVGGIELLDIASRMDTMGMQEYADLALAVTKAVYDTEYDYMAENDASCRVVVSVSSQDKREFYHYFFSGSQMGYDIWMDYSVLDTRDMRSCLKTLHSQDLYNPQDFVTISQEVPLLGLRVSMPEGVSRQPTKTTRNLFYCGTALAGGIEQIDISSDLDTLGLTAANVAKELYGREFNYTNKEYASDGKITAVLLTDSMDTHLVHYIVNVDTECYDVWADTSVITEENALAIAKSCQ